MDELVEYACFKISLKKEIDWNNITKEDVINACSVCKQCQCELTCPYFSDYRKLSQDDRQKINELAFGIKNNGKFNN